MIKSINELKRESKTFIHKNYFKLILPILILMISNSVTYLIWNYWMYDGMLFGSDLMILLCLIGIAVLQFVVCPFAIVWFYIIYLLNSDNKVENKFNVMSWFKEKNVFKNTVLLNFIPSLLNLLTLIFSSNNIIYQTKNYILLTICCFIKIIVDYKLFICNYYFLLSRKNVKLCFKVSFSIMKRRIKSYLTFYVAFIGWIMFAILLFYVFKSICLWEIFSLKLLFSFKVFTPFLNSAGAFLYGVGFYLYPYLLVTKVKYCDEILGDTVFR